ncbi:MAG: hypothetical protein PHX21_13810 [bacterium]|nr:hypothetical protein [bacterium]
MIPEEIKEQVVKCIETRYADRKHIENENMKTIVTMEKCPGANVKCKVCGTMFDLFTEKQADDYRMETGDSAAGGICPKCDCVYGRRYEF